MPEAPVTMPEISVPPPPAPPQPEVKRKAEPSILPSLFHEGYGTYQTKPTSLSTRIRWSQRCWLPLICSRQLCPYHQD